MEPQQSGQIKFRPQEYSTKTKFFTRHNEYVGHLNWHRSNYIGSHGVYKIKQHLHYLACHAPKNIRVRWYPAWIRLIKNYKKL